MALFKKWCGSEKDEEGRKRYWTLVENEGRSKIQACLAETMRSLGRENLT